jgi:uncharacterized small protein (TIGR04563 family)
VVLQRGENHKPRDKARFTRGEIRIRRMEGTVSMSGTDKRKQSLYFPESMLQDIQKEAARLDRSLSWIVQRCVKIGLPDIRKLPSVNEIPDDDIPGANV